MPDTLRTIVLIGATLSTGLMAGMFGLYSHTIMPGLRKTDDRTFVGAFQEMDKSITNPLFLLGGFLGAAVFGVLAVIVSFSEPWRQLLPWVIAALVLYAIAFILTFAVNVPLNDALKAAGPPDSIADLAAAREQFTELTWNRWNHVRTITTTVAFGLQAWVLVLYGRLTG